MDPSELRMLQSSRVSRPLCENLDELTWRSWNTSATGDEAETVVAVSNRTAPSETMIVLSK